MADILSDPGDELGQGHPRSLIFFRILVFIVSAAAIAGVVAAHFQLEGDPLAPALAIGAVVGLAISVQAMLALIQARIASERERTEAVWRERQAEMQEVAGRDELTELQNRRFFYERMHEELKTAQRLKKPLSILMLDVDDLKLINDEFGHQVGDQVLRSFGRVLNREVGEKNVTARIGGDEFAVILPGADRKEADKIAWRIWDELAKTPVKETANASIFLGVSVGTGGYPWGGETLDEIIHWADAKLYANKLERKGFKHANRNGKDEGRLVAAVVDVLSSALEIRDTMTHRHARRVARMSAFVAREMKLSEDEVLQIEYAAALHDIGKIGVTDSILFKEEALEADEWQEMRRHSELGYKILNGVDFLRDAAEIVYSHHEYYGGGGYPRGLRGNEIVLGARVFAVVDAYDAMTSRRPYREAMSQDDALEEIMRHAGSQFDPVTVEAFIRMVRRNPDGFRDEQEEFGTRVVETGRNEHHAVGAVGATAAPHMTPLDTL
ncbi:MAG: diguanylate cyclase [Chloroflexi bacterium]|nr:diguanylate cyclase [Chloroflexota bacterium]